MVSPVCLYSHLLHFTVLETGHRGLINELKHTEQKEQGQVSQPWSPQKVREAGLGCHSEEFKLGAVTSGEIAV